jgi:hypothetical protein
LAATAKKKKKRQDMSANPDRLDPQQLPPRRAQA